MRKIMYIVNPVAGKGFDENNIEIIKNRMDSTDIDYSIKISSYKGNIEILSKEAVKAGYTDIIGVGGDGTVLEVFNGLYGNEVNLGIIPSGTGNDFVKIFEIDNDINNNIDKIIEGRTKKVDIGKVNDTHFLNVVGFGIDGDIVESTEKIKKFFKGSAAYILATFLNLIKYKCKDVEINIDGKVLNRKPFLIAIGNGKYYGGGMKITPDAKIDNGKFQIIILNKITKIKFTILFKKVFTGEHVNENSVEVFYGKNIEIRSKNKIKINADGNIIGETPAVVKIIEKTQNVIY